MAYFPAYCLACAEAIDGERDDLAFCSEECREAADCHNLGTSQSPHSTALTLTLSSRFPDAAQQDSTSVSSQSQGSSASQNLSSSSTSTSYLTSTTASSRLLSTSDRRGYSSAAVRSSSTSSNSSTHSAADRLNASKPLGPSFYRFAATEDVHGSPDRRRPALHSRHSIAFAGSFSRSTSPASMIIPLPAPNSYETSAETLYRDHYPKFAASRRLNGSVLRAQSADEFSTSRSPRLSASQAGLDHDNDIPLLTPPPLLRALSTNAELPPTPPYSQDVSSAKRALPVDIEVGQDARYTLKAVSESSLSRPSSLLRRHASNYEATSSTSHHFSRVFDHVPARRSAPTRSLDISKTTTVSGSVNRSPRTGTSVRSTHRLAAFTCASAEPIAPMHQPNSLGLEIEHIEDASPSAFSQTSPFQFSVSNGSLSTSAQNPFVINDSVTDKNKSSASLSASGNNMSPLPCASPLMTLIKSLDIHEGEGGIRSVDGSYAYTLGDQEASYIIRKLMEEQRRRQEKERLLAHTESLETRGRSRSRKRAGSSSINSQRYLLAT